MIARPIRFALASVVTLALASCNDSSAPADGGNPLPPGLTLKVDPFVSGLSSPVFLTQPLNDGRIFVVEQPGRIRVVKDGVLQATPFLNISTRVLSGGERGLLSVAFHPQYATNHYFYVYFTTQTTGDIRIERFTSTTADVADPATSKLIFTTPHPNGNHNGGLVSFGPDGMLYAAMGDGGGGSPDQDGNGQNFNAYLGGMIRIDVDQGDPYSVPATNPFVGQANKKPELWAKGLRNPWRYAFDAVTSMLYIADVGESAHEEVDAVGATLGGLNFGWRIMEGSSCFGAATCTQTGLTLPVLDYSHANGACSITGGYVYRGSAIPAIRGHYFYSDYCAGFLKSFRYDNGLAADQKDWGITMSAVSSFGKDFAGELYIMTGSNIVKVAQGT
jgi:glucose/arabinose dehydrogenase